ncbi:MAG: GNAT family N-acetyltransferase [Bdellovibrionaceae bacterium]|nr:GNAT family N-acetyltransferase [Pseudobdellovibrionaceae bacterium]
MEIIYPALKVADWRALVDRAPRANWMQTWPYAVATFRRDQKQYRVGVIQDGGRELGFFVLQEIRLGPIHFVNLMRGPLFFTPHEDLELLKRFAEALNREFPRRFLRRRRWMPEWPFSEEARNIIIESGFVSLPQTSETFLVPTCGDLSGVRARLAQKWRNGLNKAEGFGLKVQINEDLQGLSDFVLCYQRFKKEKNFLGPSPAFILEEIRAGAPFRDYWRLVALDGDLPVAGILVAKHGRTASYRIGWNSERGRKTNAHYLLLWTAIEKLNQAGCEGFDLGGILDEEKDKFTQNS